MYGYIYETTNLVNGKKYIGKHVSKTYDKKYYGSGTSFTKDFNKYGECNFSVRIIEECDDIKSLIDKEIYYIKLFDAVKNPKYYNNSYGGEQEGWEGVNKAIKEGHIKIKRFSGEHHTEESKAKISKALKGRPSPMKGKHISERHRQAIIEFNHQRKGWKMSEEAKKRVSEGCKGRKVPLERRHKISETMKKVSKTETYITNLSNSMKNRKHITNGKENRFIKIENLNEYLSEGWKLGQTNGLKKEGDLYEV